MKRILLIAAGALAVAGCAPLSLGGMGDGRVEPPAEETPAGGVADTSPDPSGALLRQGRAQLATGDYTAAAATMERAIRIEPDNPWPWLELAHVHLVAGDLRQAEAHANRALSLAGNDMDARRAAERTLADIARRRE